MKDRGARRDRPAAPGGAACLDPIGAAALRRCFWLNRAAGRAEPEPHRGRGAQVAAIRRLRLEGAGCGDKRRREGRFLEHRQANGLRALQPSAQRRRGDRAQPFSGAGADPFGIGRPRAGAGRGLGRRRERDAPGRRAPHERTDGGRAIRLRLRAERGRRSRSHRTGGRFSPLDRAGRRRALCLPGPLRAGRRGGRAGRANRGGRFRRRIAGTIRRQQHCSGRNDRRRRRLKLQRGAPPVEAYRARPGRIFPGRTLPGRRPLSAGSRRSRADLQRGLSGCQTSGRHDRWPLRAGVRAPRKGRRAPQRSAGRTEDRRGAERGGARG